MSEIQGNNGGNVDLWRKKDKIRQMFAPDLTPYEFEHFVGLGASLGANPFNREIWAVKYGNSPAQIFLGRDFYRRKAQEREDYNGHQVDVVYENDSFQMEEGTVKHSYELQDRGKIIGAYSTVYRDDNKPFFVFCEFVEYSTGKGLWDKKPATMIKKVAESQALRGAFQGLFAGTYDSSEEWEEVKEPPAQERPQVGDALPPEIESLKDRYPFDKSLKAPKSQPHKPYLGDSTPKELNLVEADIRDCVIEPRYLRYFYTISNKDLDYLHSIVSDVLAIDNKEIE